MLKFGEVNLQIRQKFFARKLSKKIFDLNALLGAGKSRMVTTTTCFDEHVGLLTTIQLKCFIINEMSNKYAPGTLFWQHNHTQGNIMYPKRKFYRVFSVCTCCKINRTLCLKSAKQTQDPV